MCVCLLATCKRLHSRSPRRTAPFPFFGLGCHRNVNSSRWSTPTIDVLTCSLFRFSTRHHWREETFDEMKRKYSPQRKQKKKFDPRFYTSNRHRNIGALMPRRACVFFFALMCRKTSKFMKIYYPFCDLLDVTFDIRISLFLNLKQHQINRTRRKYKENMFYNPIILSIQSVSLKLVF